MNAANRILLALALYLGSALVASAGSDETISIWQGLDAFVELAPQDALGAQAAPANEHPVTISATDLTEALAALRVKEGERARETAPLFTADAAERLSGPLAAALARATPNQDVLFAIDMAQKAVLIGSKPVSVAGRAFYREQRLNLIIGELHVSTVPPEYKDYPIGYPKLDRRLHPHQTGGRAEETHYPRGAHFELGENVSLFMQDAKPRADWLIVNVGALAAGQVAHPSPPVATATLSVPMLAPTQPVAAVAAPSMADAATKVPSGSIEERLRRLKSLRDQDLITPEDYERKRREILDQL